MAAAIGLRDGFTATELRRLAQSRRDAGQVRRDVTPVFSSIWS